jgi:hypothetical protein
VLGVIALLFTLQFTPPTANPSLAADFPPYFDVYLELDINRAYRSYKRHKALAIGINNLGWYAHGYRTLREARKIALSGCVSRLRRELKIKGDTQCLIVMENDKVVWPNSRPKPIESNYLPQPDGPLIKGKIVGNLADAKAILLALHGCDGPGDPNHPWIVGWHDYFVKKGFAVVQPNSLADPQSIVCGFDVPPSRLDPSQRLRVAQTLRTLANLKKRFPKKPVYIWGHSAGGLVAQLLDYDVKGIIVTGAGCLAKRIATRRPLFHVFGGNDPYASLGDKSKPLTEENVRALCGHSKKGKKTFAIVPQGDHWVYVTVPAVSEGLDKFIGKLK